MLTNPHDAFRGQSRSPNIGSFHMLCIVSSCAIVTLTLRRAVFLIFDVKKCCDLEIRVRGHSRSLKVVLFDRLRMVSYQCYRNIVPKMHSFHLLFRIFYIMPSVNVTHNLNVIIGLIPWE